MPSRSAVRRTSGRPGTFGHSVPGIGPVGTPAAVGPQAPPISANTPNCGWAEYGDDLQALEEIESALKVVPLQEASES